MKHFINILVILILTGFTVGVTFLQVNYGEAWFISYIPLIVMMFVWGIKLDNDYKNK